MSKRLSACVFAVLASCPVLRAAFLPDTFEAMVPMRDGVRLFTYGTKPKKGEKVPIVIVRNPYVSELAPGEVTSFALSQKAALRHGYACVVQHCRGCGRSEGDWIPFEHEREDGLDLLDWVRKLPWYNGEIFLSGGSYLSAVHWAYLDTNPPDVKGAVLPVMDVYRYNISYRNGAFKLAFFRDWTLQAYRVKDHSLKRDKSINPREFPLSDFPKRYWGVDEPLFANIFAHPDRNDPFWTSDEPGSGKNSRRAFLDSTMPILLKTAAFDVAVEGDFEMWRETPRERLANCALLVDAYDHGGAIANDMRGTLGDFPGGFRQPVPADIEWFDYCRTGKPCAGATPGRIRYFALWENRWIEEDSMEDGPRRIDFTLGEGTRSWTYDPLRQPPDFPGSAGNSFAGMRPQHEPDFRDDVVSFVLPAIEETLDARGRMQVELAVSSDCEDTAFVVRVSVDKGDGRWYFLRDDITSICADGRDYEPGTETKLVYRFPELAFRLVKGDRLRVDVASACDQFSPHGNVKGNQLFIREPKKARNSVRADGSTLTLFVLPKEAK